mgnify:FL=1
MTERREVRIDQEKGRLDKVLSDQLNDLSRSKIQDLIQTDQVTVNGQAVKANYQVAKGDKVVLTIPPVQEVNLEAEAIPVPIVYQDSDLAVVNKPQNMVVHPSLGHPDHTLVNALLYQLDNLSGINGELRPGIVHRIDKDTSGLLVVAKNDLAHQSLSKQLKDKTVDRHYLALVHGHVPHPKGTIDAPIGRDSKDRKKYAVTENGKEAITHFDLIRYFGQDYSLIQCQLETGRTHQIRVHLAYIGFPLAGDPLYGPKKTLEGPGQYLHAKTLGFDHPRTGQRLSFTSDLPQVFHQALKELDLKYK